MFNCQKCSVPQASHVSPVRVVTQVYKRVYHHHDGQSMGTEVAKEMDMCTGCAATAGEPEVVGTRDTHAAPQADSELIADSGDGGVRRWRDRRET